MPAARQDADGLVADVLETLSATFEQQLRHLEGRWSDGEPDTEELRSALRRYRDFFDPPAGHLTTQCFEENFRKFVRDYC